MEPLSHLIVSQSLRGWVGEQEAHLSSGPLGFAEGSSTASLSLCRVPAAEERGRLQSMGSLRVGHD